MTNKQSTYISTSVKQSETDHFLQKHDRYEIKIGTFLTTQFTKQKKIHGRMQQQSFINFLVPINYRPIKIIQFRINI